jgi:DNA-damage-inducible protein D
MQHRFIKLLVINFFAHHMKNNSNKELQVIGPNKDFESIKKLDENGVEYWQARELMRLFGYSEWRSFDEVINKAIIAAQNSNQNTENHFGHLTKMVRTGSDSIRPVKDWKLDRYACYLVAQNGDSHKAEIAAAQTYFAIQTRRQEIIDNLSQAERRLFIRKGISMENKFLFGIAKDAEVSGFGSFNDAGYRGLYNTPLSDVEKRISGTARKPSR